MRARHNIEKAKRASAIARVLSCSIRGYKPHREALSWFLTKATVSDDFVTPAAWPLHVHPDSVAFQLRKIGMRDAEKINETLGEIAAGVLCRRRVDHDRHN
ncbi:MAG: hypothetical protein ACTSXX_11155 [Candidatus Baldrarchaeia archaeon]